MQDDYYAIDRTVRTGPYPGTVVSSHPSLSAAVEEMLRLNEAMDANAAEAGRAA